MTIRVKMGDRGSQANSRTLKERLIGVNSCYWRRKTNKKIINHQASPNTRVTGSLTCFYYE